MRWTIPAVLALGLALVAPQQSFAQEPSYWFVRGNAAWVNPTGDYSSGGVSIDPGSGLGGGLGVGYRLNQLVQFDLDGIYSSHKFDVKDTPAEVRGDDSTSVPMVLFGVNFHVLKDCRADLYLGPLVGWVMYDDLEVGGFKYSGDDDFAYGANLGVDVPFGKGGWVFNALLKYVVTGNEFERTICDNCGPDPGGEGQGAAKANLKQSFDTDFNPLILQVGLAYRF